MGMRSRATARVMVPSPPVKSWLSRYISKYRVFEIRIVAGLFVMRLVADDVYRFYNESQQIFDINFDSETPEFGSSKSARFVRLLNGVSTESLYIVVVYRCI